MLFLLGIGITIVSVPLFVFGLILSDCFMMMWSVVALYSGTVIYCINNQKMKYAAIFMGSWGVFMLGRLIVRIPEGVYLLTKFTLEECIHTFISLYLALVFFFLGLVVYKNIRFKWEHKKWNKDFLLAKIDNSAIRFLSGIAFGITIPFHVGVLYYYVQTAMMTGYRSLYLNGTSNIPGYLDALSRVHISALIIYLVLFPKKKMVYLVSGIELAISALYLVAGKRIEFIQVVILTAVVFLIRDTLKVDPYPFFTKKKVIIIGSAGIGLIILLQFIGYNRFSQTMDQTGIISIITDFLDTIGYSVEIIPLGKRHINDFYGENYLYFWGPLLNWFKSITGIGTVYSGQTLETVQYGYAFGDALTYFESSYLYLVSGGGLGSSYIAELYHSYGYLGIAVFNLLLGNMINRLWVNSLDSWFSRYIKIFIFIGVVLLPRFNCWVWITDVISKVNIAFWIVLIIGTQVLKKNRLLYKSGS